jgi:23S rRNA (uracil1939-C5)-methyltransferase
VRFALPGERISVSGLVRRGEGWTGVLDDVVEASPERVDPPCPHFGACGGCALQNWADTPYRAWKSGLLDDALRRAGFETPALAPLAITPPGARRRMDFALRRVGTEVTVGLHAPRGSEIVDLQTCVVLHPKLVALIAPLRDVLRGLSGLRREGSAIVNLLDSGPDLLLRGDAQLRMEDRKALATFADKHGIPRISWAEGTGAPEPACTLRPSTTTISGVQIAPAPGAFLQASREGEAAIVEAVVANPPKLTLKSRIADLYSGSGTLSFALARLARVDAFEGEASAVATLRAGANGAGLAGRLTAHLRDLTRQPLLAKELSAYAAVVLDPPFAGAPVQIREIAASKVKRVVYVSCNPVALAREIGVLREAGFRLLAATPIDQFLWSARLESVVALTR